MLTVGSLFAGIGGFDLGFERAGFRVRWQAEQDGKAQAVLSARFPDTRLYDDVRAIGAEAAPVDVMCGGFPCRQDVSVAGKREGLRGERTGLFWEVVRIARVMRPRWMVLENVPGLLSSHGGRDFHAVLEALAECGFRRAYRILDSRYFGVPQRRRRVFIVLRAREFGDGPGEVLFESAGGAGDSAAGDKARPDVADSVGGFARRSGENRVAFTLNQSHGTQLGNAWNTTYLPLAGLLGGGHDGIGRRSEDDPNLVAVGVHANQRGELRTSAFTGSLNGSRSGKQFEGVLAVRTAQTSANGHGIADNIAHTLDGATGQAVFATLNSGGNDGGFRTEPGEHLVATALSASMGHHGHSSPRGDGSDNLVAATIPERARALTGSMWKGHDDDTDTLIPQHGVRRLTPLECERLQGFPDGWTCLCGQGHLGSQFCACADSPRYRQLGNAVTVPVAEWIARRLAIIDAQERTR